MTLTVDLTRALGELRAALAPATVALRRVAAVAPAAPSPSSEDDRDLADEVTTYLDARRALQAVRTSAPDRRRVQDDLVRLAARRLDAVRTGWRARLNLGDLDLTDPYRCVLARVFGRYEDGLRALYGTSELTDELPADVAAFTGIVPTAAWRRHLDAA